MSAIKSAKTAPTNQPLLRLIAFTSNETYSARSGHQTWLAPHFIPALGLVIVTWSRALRLRAAALAEAVVIKEALRRLLLL